MKVLVVGLFDNPQYEPALVEALRAQGLDAVGFATAQYWRPGDGARILRRAWPEAVFAGLNRDLRRRAVEERPDAIFFRRSTEVWPSTLRYLRERTRAALVSYMNDDPLGFRSRHSMWRSFVRAIPLFDFHFVFRDLNVPEYYGRGARHCEVLLPYFVPTLHRPVSVTPEDSQRFGCDALFIGHGVPDHRVPFLRALVEAGLRVRVRGPLWGGAAMRRRLGPIVVEPPVFGEEYVRALRAANACLSFYDHLNRDAITTRNMEIPACGAVLVAERSVFAEAVLREGSEALYFDSPKELIEKVRRLKFEQGLRERVIAGGLAWAARGEHTVDARIKRVIEVIASTAPARPAREECSRVDVG